MRYAGEYLDPTGLYNLRARLYNPTIGQFTTLDPLLDQTHTPYSYGLNSPLRYSDPSGLAAEDFFDAIAGLGTGYDQAMDALLWGGVEAIAYPDREFREAFIDPCNAGFDEYGAGGYGFMACVDNLNPIAQIGRGTADAYNLAQAGCYYDAGRAAVPPLLQAGGIAATVAGGGAVSSLLKPGSRPGSSTGAPRNGSMTPAAGLIDRSLLSTRLSQRQGRHLLGDPDYDRGSYFTNRAAAQQVLDDFHSGHATILGMKGNDVVVRTDVSGGFNHNPGSGYTHQPTDVFFIKGTSSPSVVPYNPQWTP